MRLKKYLKIAYYCSKVGLMNKMVDKLNFVSILFGTLLKTGVTIIFFQAIFSQTNSLGGWSINEVYVLMGTILFIEVIGTMFYTRGYYQMPYMIEDGRLDSYLLKPLILRFYFIIHRIEIVHTWPTLLIALSLVGYGSIASELGINILHYSVVLICSIIMHFSITLIFHSLNFFFRFFHINNLLNEIFGLGQYPITIYRGIIKIALTILIPVAFIFSLPVQVFFGNTSNLIILITILVTFVFYYLSKTFWNYGLKKYE